MGCMTADEINANVQNPEHGFHAEFIENEGWDVRIGKLKLKYMVRNIDYFRSSSWNFYSDIRNHALKSKKISGGFYRMKCHMMTKK